jgi:hypothetical protein
MPTRHSTLLPTVRRPPDETSSASLCGEIALSGTTLEDQQSEPCSLIGTDSVFSLWQLSLDLIVQMTVDVSLKRRCQQVVDVQTAHPNLLETFESTCGDCPQLVTAGINKLSDEAPRDVTKISASRPHTPKELLESQSPDQDERITASSFRHPHCSNSSSKSPRPQRCFSIED